MKNVFFSERKEVGQMVLEWNFFKSILYSTLLGAEAQAEVKALENAFFMRMFESKIQGWTFERQ